MMKPILTLLLIVGMSLSSTWKVLATPNENYSDSVQRLTVIHNSDCKGDRDDDCR